MKEKINRKAAMATLIILFFVYRIFIKPILLNSTNLLLNLIVVMFITFGSYWLVVQVANFKVKDKDNKES